MTVSRNYQRKAQAAAKALKARTMSKAEREQKINRVRLSLDAQEYMEKVVSMNCDALGNFIDDAEETLECWCCFRNGRGESLPMVSHSGNSARRVAYGVLEAMRDIAKTARRVQGIHKRRLTDLGAEVSEC